MISQFGVEEIDWSAQSSDHNVWDELEHRLRARPNMSTYFRPCSVKKHNRYNTEDHEGLIGIFGHVAYVFVEHFC